MSKNKRQNDEMGDNILHDEQEKAETSILNSLLDPTAIHPIRRIELVETKTESESQEADKLFTDKLLDEQVKEQSQRRHFRWAMFGTFIALLILQYIGLSILLIASLAGGFIADIQPLLAIIIPATLGETYAIVKVMVTFVFSPGNFKPYDSQTKIS